MTTFSKKIFSYMKSAQAMALPTIILCGALILKAAFPQMPDLGASMLYYFLFIAAMIGGLMSYWFNRTKVLFSILVLLIGYFFVSYKIQTGIGDNVFGKFIFPIFCFLAPINLILFLFLDERGLLSVHGLIKIVLISLQTIFVWFFAFNADIFMDISKVNLILNDMQNFLAYRFFDESYDFWTPVPQMALIVFVLVFLTILIKATITGKPMECGFLVMIICLFFGLHFTGNGVSSEFYLAAILSLTAAVLQDSYHMAFNDQLTGIPGRQALVADLKKLGGSYTIAMLDIDFFKKFNDTYGHDIGDQVLKMVASHISHVGGGGKAYRYGGEEFTIVFPSKNKKDALAHLEETRRRVAEAGFRLRSQDRPQEDLKIEEKRGKTRIDDRNIVTVTISIGFAERGRSDSSPQDVIKKADTALYKAKKEGRNRVVSV